LRRAGLIPALIELLDGPVEPDVEEAWRNESSDASVSSSAEE